MKHANFLSAKFGCRAVMATLVGCAMTGLFGCDDDDDLNSDPIPRKDASFSSDTGLSSDGGLIPIADSAVHSTDSSVSQDSEIGDDASISLDSTLNEDASLADDDASLDEDSTIPEDAGEEIFEEPWASPQDVGLYEVETIELETQVLSTTDGNRETPLVLHLPKREKGLSPLVIMLPTESLECWRYDPLADFWASHGFAVLSADPTWEMEDHQAMANDVSVAINRLLSGPYASKIDQDHVVAAGHGLGGKVALLTALMDSKITAVFGLDAVNAKNLLGMYTDTAPDITDSLARLSIVIGLAGETVSSSSSSLLTKACVPSDQNYLALARAATSASWRAAWRFEGVDHMDFLFDKTECTSRCSACGSGTVDEETTRSRAKLLSTAFLRWHCYGETSMENYLTGSAVPNGVMLESLN